MAVDDEAGPALEGRTIGITADRRWQEQADLFAKRGAAVLHGPTMRTVDLTEQPQLRDVTELVVASPPDALVVTTGGGFRRWLDTAEAWGRRDALLDALARRGTRMICRGAKGASAVRGAGLDVAWRAEHETMQEVVAHVRAGVPREQSLVVQLFDPDDHWATATLRELHPDLVEVPVYRWLLPADTAPALQLIDAVIDRRVDAVTFTSQPAVRNLFAIADGAGRDAAALRTALDGDVLVVCVGPVCAEAVHECGVSRCVWPDPPRLVPMVKLAEERLGRR
ncbi:MAG TPA: uroporphyrinogen-III synthase [Acidimicrobiales bacterium]|nr:uroporphyrinogen-III synthase [Acidimicrobiales bacterium]